MKPWVDPESGMEMRCGKCAQTIGDRAERTWSRRTLGCECLGRRVNDETERSTGWGRRPLGFDSDWMG